jgi:hypothetical protein
LEDEIGLGGCVMKMNRKIVRTRWRKVASIGRGPLLLEATQDGDRRPFGKVGAGSRSQSCINKHPSAFRMDVNQERRFLFMTREVLHAARPKFCITLGQMLTNHSAKLSTERPESYVTENRREDWRMRSDWEAV